MLVLSSPSGAGKTTLARALLDQEPGLQMSVSFTTRQQRPGEVDGKDYRFVDPDTFAAMRDRGEFLEWALVFDHFYGTPRQTVRTTLAEGRDILFDIDWQGAAKLRQSEVKSDLVSVFILPPSVEALEARLTKRAQDSSDVVRKRMAGAANEIQHWNEYDYVIVNQEVDRSLAAIKCILAAERLRRQRCEGLNAFVKRLQSQL